MTANAAAAQLNEASDKSIVNWLDARRSLLVLFTRLCQMKPRTHNPITFQMLNEFNEILVDYVSAGHFDVFEKIAASSKGKQFDNRVFIKILESTNLALDFCDRYGHSNDYSSLCDDLSALGEQLETRFSYEDRLIALYQESIASA